MKDQVQQPSQQFKKIIIMYVCLCVGLFMWMQTPKVVLDPVALEQLEQPDMGAENQIQVLRESSKVS